ncbi:unnamed protein product, partial [Gongylonema pulchrum]|uniref:Protein dopey-1 n=1 Tax=Gongylonema pulchrum TaxID=637853 RepID=A0A183E822_9BILA
MGALDFLTEIIHELIAMIQENRCRALVAYVHGILQRSKLQKCLLHSLLTCVHNVRHHVNAEKVPLSVDILEFNDGSRTAKNDFNDLITGYQSSLLYLSATVIQLELVIKNGFQNFTDQDTGSVNADKLSINQQIYNSPLHRAPVREPHVGMVELRMFLLTVLNALKKQPFRQEQWLNFVVQILPFLDRSLSTFSVHIVEQLCKNLECAVSAAYCSPDDRAHAVAATAHAHSPDTISQPSYPTNYVIQILETLTTFVHYCLIDNSSQTSAHPPSQATTVSSNPSLASSVMNAIPGTRGATELISSLVK